MQKSIGRLTVLTAAVLPIVALTTAALADDDKTYPGAMCRPLSSTDAVGLRAADGAMPNLSLERQTWICPVVREHMDEDPEFVRITVQENMENSRTPVACTFEARDPNGDGALGKAISNKVSTVPLLTAPTVAVQYTLGSGDADALDNVKDHGYYYIRCDVPGRGTAEGHLSGVITYKVSEND